jgi:RPA family protein
MRIFSVELKLSEIFERGDNSFYLLTPLGSACNRVYITGVLAEKKRMKEHWKLEIDDGLGIVECLSTKYSSIQNRIIEGLKTTELIGVVGKPRKFGEDVKLRLEEVFSIRELDRKIWVIEAICSAENRLRAIESRRELLESHYPDLKKRIEELKASIGELASIISSELLYLAIKKLLEEERSHRELLTELNVPENILNEVIEELLLKGEIYEPRAGIYKRVA